MQHHEMRDKTCKLLCGERGHIDDILRFIHEKFNSGHGLGSIARMLELSYDELYDVLIHVRARIRQISHEMESMREAA